MRRLYLTSVLIFTLGLVFGPAVQAEGEKTTMPEQKAPRKPSVGSGQISDELFGKLVDLLAEAEERIAKQTRQPAREAEKEVAEAPEKETSKYAEIRGTEQKKTAEAGVVSESLRHLLELLDAPEQRKKRPKIEETAITEEEVIEEITGLIIEQTMTRIGYEFYENFFILWEAPEGIKDYNIFISERASPLWGSWVRIDIDTTTVWSRVLRPRAEEIAEAVKNAVEVTKEYLYRYEEYKRELEGADMIGSGI